jgi:hypothetical protein
MLRLINVRVARSMRLSNESRNTRNPLIPRLI